MSPSLGNSGDIIARTATPTQPLSPNGGMPPVFVVFICAGVFAISMISHRLWRRNHSREEFQADLAYVLATRGRNTSSDTANSRPEIFDAWTKRITLKSLKWEEYMPFTLNFLTEVQAQSPTKPVRKVGQLWGESGREKTEGEDQDHGDCRLQVGILVAMPSRLHRKCRGGVGLEISGSSLRDGLVIGLTEMPLGEEDRRFHKKSCRNSSSPECGSHTDPRSLHVHDH